MKSLQQHIQENLHESHHGEVVWDQEWKPNNSKDMLDTSKTEKLADLLDKSSKIKEWEADESRVYIMGDGSDILKKHNFTLAHQF